MSERRYSEDEIAEIFERASETQKTAPPVSRGGEGLTLTELQEIGGEVGIAPDLVARAARSLTTRDTGRDRRLLGVPIGVGHTVVLDRALTDEEWQRLVVDLRETFDARGRMTDDGPFKQWTNGNLEVLLEPTATGQRLRMRTVKGNAVGMVATGLVMLGVAAVAFVDMTVSNELMQRLPGLLTLLGVGGGLVGVNAIRLPAWARLRRGQMREIGERLTVATALPPGQ